MERQPQPGCPAKFNASDYDRTGSGQYKHFYIYILCNMIHFQIYCSQTLRWPLFKLYVYVYIENITVLK